MRNDECQPLRAISSLEDRGYCAGDDAGQIGPIPKRLLSLMIASSSSSILTSVPDHLPEQDTIAKLCIKGDELAALIAETGADSDHFALHRLSFAVSGMMIPPAVFSSSSMRRTTTRSWSGRNFMASYLNVPEGILYYFDWPKHARTQSSAAGPSDLYKELLSAISSVEYQNAPD